MASAGECAQRNADAGALKVRDAQGASARQTRRPRAGATARSTVTAELLKGAAVILLLIFALVWVQSLDQHLALQGPTPKSSSSPSAPAGPDQP
jgi:hypothetical protein